MAIPALCAFTNTHILSSGEALPQDLYFSPTTGLITPNYTRSRPDANVTKIDLEGQYVVAPGYLELQMNGGWGVHFTTLGKWRDSGDDDTADDEEEQLKKVARELVKCGVTAWWATVPTVEEGRWKEILPHLYPRTFENAATLLGAHMEGPYLQPSKNGAHNPAYFQIPANTPPRNIYGSAHLRDTIKLITIAPELPGSLDLIRELRLEHPEVTISLGHSSATYQQGQEGLRAGATGLTHVFNAMNPLHHRDPGLVGLMSNNNASDIPPTTITSPDQHLLSSTTSVQDWLTRQMSSLGGPSTKSSKSGETTAKAAGANEDTKPECYYSIIPDLIHLHPSVLSMAFRTSPAKCMLITDSIELAGLPDGEHPPNDQITSPQIKHGNKATIKGTNTLIGSCITLDECVRNMVRHAGCSLAEAVRCVTENVARFMGETTRGGRGRLDIGCRADFVILDTQGNVRQTWIRGVKVWDVEVDEII